MTANEWDWLTSLIRKLIEQARVACDDTSDSESEYTANSGICDVTRSLTDLARNDDALADQIPVQPVANDTRPIETA